MLPRAKHVPVTNSAGMSARNYIYDAQSRNATEDLLFIIWRARRRENIVDIIYTPTANGPTIISS